MASAYFAYSREAPQEVVRKLEAVGVTGSTLMSEVTSMLLLPHIGSTDDNQRGEELLEYLLKGVVK